MEFRLPERSGDYEYSTSGSPASTRSPARKATEEVEAPVSGTLGDILAEEGDEVKVDTVLAIIEEA